MKKHNYITATGVTGIYKDKSFEFHIEPHANQCKLFIEGKEVKGVISNISVRVKAGYPTTFRVETLTEYEP